MVAGEGYLDAVPVDPFSGQPFVYDVRNGGFVLYSVGVDGDDDGGTPAGHGINADGDFVFWPRPQNSNEP